MKNRITELFKNKKGNILNVYYTAGYPATGDTIRIAKALEEGGADIIEIGIPFSDPVADGPTIQASNKVALDQGMTLKLLLEQLKEIRKQVNIPIILMGYINPVMQYGVEKFAREVSAIGVDGVILPDLPLHEFEVEYKALFDSVNLCNTFLISPTTSDDRIRKIDAVTEGFIYAVSASSITGAKGDFSSEQLAYFERLQKMKLSNPFLIGFGISNQATFSTASRYSAGAIVGSAFINLLKESKNLEADIKQFVKSLKA
jgi:tryptophan synthase alpha chain